MKFTIAIALLSTAKSAAIKTANQIEVKKPLTNEVPQNIENGVEHIKLPDWFVKFNNYMKLEDESEFDLDGFLDQLQDEEIQDLSLLLYLMEGDESYHADLEVSLSEENQNL